MLLRIFSILKQSGYAWTLEIRKMVIDLIKKITAHLILVGLGDKEK